MMTLCAIVAAFAIGYLVGVVVALRTECRRIGHRPMMLADDEPADLRALAPHYCGRCRQRLTPWPE